MQIAAVALSAASVWYTTQKRALGPLLGLASCVPWAVLAVLTHTYITLAVEALWVYMDARMWLIWRNQDAPPAQVPSRPAAEVLHQPQRL